MPVLTEMKKIKELINKNNKLLYSIPYQHFTNCIKNYFSIFKSKMRKLKGLKYIEIKDNILKVIKDILKETFKNIFYSNIIFNIMSVQIILPTFQLISASPVYVCPNNELAAFQASSKVIVNKNANAGFNQQNTTVWSYYWNSPAQNATVGVKSNGNVYC